MKKLLLHTVFILGYVWQAAAQDTTILPVIHLKSSIIELVDIGSLERQTDSLIIAQYQGRSLSDILQNESPAFIKSYGATSLQTISFRGTGAAHTNVVWNGIPLNNLNSGVTDFMLLPVQMNSKFSLITGASGTRFGSSSIGGTIIIDHAHQNTQPGIQISQSVGSYGYGNFQVASQTQHKKLTWNSGYNYTQASNDFTFTNTRILGFPEQVLQNAAFHNWHKTDEIQYRIKKTQLLSLHSWIFSSSRELPGGMASMPNFAAQHDKGKRFCLLWSVRPNTFSKLESRVYYAYDWLQYEDPEINLNSEAHTKMKGVQQNWQHRVIRKELYILSYSLNHSFQLLEGNSSTFNQKKEWLFSPFVSVDLYLLPIRLKAQWRVRKEWRTTTEVPYIPAIGLEWKWKQLQILANAGKHFRVPTFNDKYWRPGGNPNLLPESGSSYDLTGVYHFPDKQWQLQLTAYRLRVNNWIQWTPGSNGYWEPMNLFEVISQGVENSISFQKHLNRKFNICIGNQLIWNRSENQDKPGYQLIYSPKIQNKSQFTFSRTNIWSIRWTTQLVGKRFTTVDHSNSLNSQALHHIFFSLMPANQSKLALHFQCSNIFDQQGIGVEGQVQMGRQYILSINLKLDKLR